MTKDELLAIFRSGYIMAVFRYNDQAGSVYLDTLIAPGHADMLTEDFWAALKEHQAAIAVMVKQNDARVCCLPDGHKGYYEPGVSLRGEPITVCKACADLREQYAKMPPGEPDADIYLGH